MGRFSLRIAFDPIRNSAEAVSVTTSVSGGQVKVFGKGQQHKADGAGEHGEDQQPAFFQAIDDVAAVKREQGGDEHRDTQQQTNVLLVEAEFVAQEQREQRAGDGAADDDGQRQISNRRITSE